MPLPGVEIGKHIIDNRPNIAIDSNGNQNVNKTWVPNAHTRLSVAHKNCTEVHRTGNILERLFIVTLSK